MRAFSGFAVLILACLDCGSALADPAPVPYGSVPYTGPAYGERYPAPSWEKQPVAVSPGAETGKPVTDFLATTDSTDSSQFTLGVRNWISVGQSTIRVTGPMGVPDLLSELKWR